MQMIRNSFVCLNATNYQSRAEFRIVIVKKAYLTTYVNGISQDRKPNVKISGENSKFPDGEFPPCNHAFNNHCA